MRLLTLLVLAGCRGGFDAEPAASRSKGMADEADDWDGANDMREESRSRAKPKSAPARSEMAIGDEGAAGGVGYLSENEPSPPPPAEQEAAAAETRSWFPETFLWEPLVVTDEAGRADVSVTVPDRLTSWRVLALAHSRDGHQAGAVTTFLGTLPVYVDPVVPAFLRAGDEVVLPVQVVNTTDTAISEILTVSATGAAGSRGGGAVRVPAGGSIVQRIAIKATRSGTIELKASLGSSDAIARSIPVSPNGRLVEQSRGGTLASERTATLRTPPGTDPDSARARLVVFPGALALVKSELTAAPSRDGTADAAYALLLSGRAPSLLEALGGETDPEALRDMTLVSGQRAIRSARVADVSTASLLAEAALWHPENAVISRLGERMAVTLEGQQRPDGTFGGGSGWTLQRVLMTTAEASRAVRAAADAPSEDAETAQARKRRAASVGLRSAAAFERFGPQITDGYTAAAVLASGAVEGELAATLRKLVVEAVEVEPDGARVLRPEADIVRADGRAPSVSEATALAVLALRGPNAPDWLPDLGAALLGRYRPGSGWGDGRTNLACLQAVVAVFDQPIPDDVRVTLRRDGQVVAEGSLSRDQLQGLVILDAPAGVSGGHDWTVQADPAVAGLGFLLTLQTWVPWEESSADRGLELSVQSPTGLSVGRPAELAFAAAAPSGVTFTITQDLPAGVQVDEAALAELQGAGTITSYAVEDGRVAMTAAALQPGQAFQAGITVVPTLAGSLSTGPSNISVTGRDDLAYVVPPQRWVIR